MRLADFLRESQEDIIAAWGGEARELANEGELPGLSLLDRLPHVLDELAAALERGREAPGAETERHADHRRRQQIPLREVRAEYEILRRTVHRLYRQRAGTDSLQLFDHELDEAMVQAVSVYRAR